MTGEGWGGELIIELWDWIAMFALLLLSGFGVAELLGYYEPVSYQTPLGAVLLGLWMLAGSNIVYRIGWNRR